MAQVQSNSDRETRLRFMSINEETSALLREIWPSVEAVLPAVLEGFYQHVSREPQLARLVGSQASRLKQAQQIHWARLFNGRFDEQYIEGVRTIGLVHNKIGLEPRWYIGGYNFVLGRLMGLVTQKYKWKPEKAAKICQAIVAAVMLDMDFAISVYQEAMIAERQERQNKVDAAIKSFDTEMTKVLESVSSSSESMRMTAQSMAGTAEETSRQATAVTTAADQASTNVQTVASAAEELSASIAEIGRQVEQSTHVTNKAVGEAGETNQIVRSLADNAQRIGDVVKLINDIAGQTNLLALNATEVKSLANQTAKATEEIGQQITGMQQATQRAVAAIEGIGATITDVSKIAVSIAAAVEEQDAATKEIARSVQSAATGTNEVTTNMAGVSTAATETGSGAHRVLDAAQDMSRQADVLRKEVAQFLAVVRAA